MKWLFGNKVLLQTAAAALSKGVCNVHECSANKHSEVFCSHSGTAADDNTSLLACDAVSLGAWFVMLQRNTVPSSSEKLSTLTGRHVSNYCPALRYTPKGLKLQSKDPEKTFMSRGYYVPNVRLL
jgi:hypothetical protein